MKSSNEIIIQRFKESIEVKKNISNNTELIGKISALADEMVTVLKNGGKFVICGNGGSASDALHFAGEIVGRFQKERKAWPAVVLNADVATMTAIANDYSYDDVFARQTEAHVNDNDMFIGISTSGNSENVFRALIKAKELGAKTSALLGKNGGKIAKEADYPIIIRSEVTARVQESHICIIHILCELIENNM